MVAYLSQKYFQIGLVDVIVVANVYLLEGFLQGKLRALLDISFELLNHALEFDFLLEKLQESFLALAVQLLEGLDSL